MLMYPHFGYWLNDKGKYVPDIWFDNSETSKTHYNNDKLIAILLSTSSISYSQFIKHYGAIGPHNGATYFEQKEDCLAFLEILEYMYNEIHVNGRNWYDVTVEILANNTSKTTASEAISDYYMSTAKTYKNLQSYQGTPMDINYTSLDSKDMNMGQIEENPFKPGQSKKPTHYTML